MTVQMLIIVEMRDRYALAECLQAYAERVGPLLCKTQGLQAAYLAGEEGESILAIVTLFWTNREAAVAWLNSGGDGKLHLLPFDGLKDQEGKYVLESHVVTYVPSATVLHLLRQSRSADRAMPKSFLGIGGVVHSRSVVVTAKVNGGGAASKKDVT